MEPSSSGAAEYKRWDDDNINLHVTASQSGMERYYDRFCTGNTGKIMKVAGAVVAVVVIYVIGYATGYYVHRC
ncbi:small integral membrane protein 1 [Lampris incognitus]|uniref:small integral membrane protein 1 n=1 Tax=Lampris incognitus TaxID=2546036 RepID=UPI0024B5A376|nr:small integral membrane protein 1 [Lampris incognitus]